MPPRIDVFALGDFQTNCFVVTMPNAQTGSIRGANCWIVDCGYEPEPMFAFIDREALTPRALLLTHAHADHIAGVDAALARFGPMTVYLHESERGFCSDPMLNLSGMMGMHITAAEPDHWLKGGETLELDGTRWRVLHAPGHSPGCVLFVHDESNQALVGDTLFAGSIGRIDFPTSDPSAMKRSLTEVLMSLPDEMKIFPGHGPHTTVGVERRSNPFILHGI